MSLKEWTDQMLSRIKGGRTGNEEEPEYESNMANGGFSGYRPRQEKARNIFATQSIPVQKNTMGNTASHSGMTGMFAPAPGQRRLRPDMDEGETLWHQRQRLVPGRTDAG